MTGYTTFSQPRLTPEQELALKTKRLIQLNQKDRSSSERNQLIAEIAELEEQLAMQVQTSTNSKSL